MVINLKIVSCNDIQAYKKVFIRELVNKEISLEGYPLLIIEEDFFHVCFEKGSGGVEKSVFGSRRASRMLVIRDVCKGRIPYTLIWQIYREDPTLCVLCPDIETAFYLKPRMVNKQVYLVLVTLIVYGSNVSRRIDKQIKAGIMCKSVKEALKRKEVV